MSESKEQGVMAYILESTTETGKYDLYIGVKNGVIANPDSRSFFYKFINVKTINFEKILIPVMSFILTPCSAV